MNKLYALFPAMVLAAGLSASLKATADTRQGYLYNKHTNQIMMVEDNVVKAYPYNAQKISASLWEFDADEEVGSASLKNVLSQRFIGKVGNFNQAIGTQTEEFRYKLTSALDEEGYKYYSFADTTTAGTQTSLHNNNSTNVVRWNSGTGDNPSTPSRWYFVDVDKMQAFASLQNNKLTLINLAKDVLSATDAAYTKVGDGLITQASQLSTNSQDPQEGPIADLIDNNENTYFHSSYRPGRPRIPYIALTFDNADGHKTFQVDYKRRTGKPVNIPTKLAIYGGKKQADGTIVWEAQPFTTLENSLPTTATNYEGVGAYGGFFQFKADKDYDAFRFDVLKTNSGTDFFTYSEFQLFTTEESGAKPRVVRNQLVQNASQIWSDNKEPSEGSYADLLDGNNKTFFHSTWWPNNGNNGKEHNLMFKFDNPNGATEFKFAYAARNASGNYFNRPTQIDIYGGTPNGNNFAWTKITTADAPANINTTNVNGIGGLTGVLTINTNNQAYSALKFVVIKTNTGSKFFTYGDISLYTEEVFPAGTFTSSDEQRAALNKALADLNKNLIPYKDNAEAVELAARNAINDVVPGIVNMTTQKQDLDAALKDAFAKADAAIAKAEAAIAKSDFTTKAMQQVKANNERLLDEVYSDRKELDRVYNQLVGGYSPQDIADFKELLDNLLTGVSYINVGTEDLQGLVEEFVDPSKRFRLVPIEPWLNDEYAVHWNKYSNLQVTRTDRFSKGFRATVNGETTEYLSELVPVNIYNERLDNVVEAPVGAEITIEPQYNNLWMNGYVYIDANQDKKFTWEGVEAGKTNGELVAYSHYNGFNSLGNKVASTSTLDNQFIKMPAFLAPEKPGTYRMRVKIDWNNIDAAGQYNGEYTSNFINKNGGYIFDFLLKVVDPTAISGAAGTSVAAPAFDLSGRRVNKTTQGQLIIVNGKKQLSK